MRHPLNMRSCASWAGVILLLAGACSRDGADLQEDPSGLHGIAPEDLVQVQKFIKADDHKDKDKDKDNRARVRRRVTPIIECVDEAAGKLTAHFGYRNETRQIVNIPIGLLNWIFPPPSNRGQPTQFQLGARTNVFTVTFPGNNLIVWNLDGRVAVAHKRIRRCAATPTPDAGVPDVTADVPTPMCPASCDDSNACTADRCDTATGRCLNTPLAAGQSCSDNNACNGAETCNGQGVCSPGTAPTCDDQNPCTTDSCSASGGCGSVAGNEAAACTIAGAAGSCRSGVCTPVVVNCDDGNPCTSDTANASGGCTHAPANEGGSCADANACNGAEVCRAGVCAPAPALSCDDANPCTVDRCDGTAGCVHTPQAAGFVCAPATQCGGASTCVGTVCTAGPSGSCDDNNPCTADSCGSNGACLHAPLDGTSCNDGNACNGSEMCRAGACAAGSPVVCTASDQCHDVGTCDPGTGVCSNPSKADGAICNDGNACTNTDVCRSGTCSGTAKACNATDQCHTAGVCDPATGTCSNPVAVGQTCNDGNMCTSGDVCRTDGSCAGSGSCGPTPCQVCMEGNCPPDIAGCSLLTGQERTDCEALVACADRTSCAATGDGMPCYCGTADVGACLGGSGNGACKAEVEVAAKTTDPTALGERFTDPAFPVGRAFNLYGCRAAFCADVCQ